MYRIAVKRESYMLMCLNLLGLSFFSFFENVLELSL